MTDRHGMHSGIPPIQTAADRVADRLNEDATLVRTVLANGFSWMRFPAGLEQQFLNDCAPQRLRHFMVSGFIALVIFNAFLVCDYLMAVDVFWLGMKLRLGLFTPVALLVLIVGAWKGDWVLRHISPLLMESVVLTSGLLAAASLAFILSSTHSGLSQYYHVGFAVVVIYGNVVQRLRFWYAVVFSLAVYAMHIGGVILIPGFNERLMLPIVSMLGATVIFTLASNYAMERDERKRYLLSRREKDLARDLSDVHARLQQLSRMDDLTGLYNRRHFEVYLQQIWARAQHDAADIAIIMMDVDHFKKYNDRYGHPTGDDCLSRVADAMASCLRRPGDLVARFGGEEFIAVLPETNASFALQVAERIRQAVEDLQIRHEGSTTAFVVTASVGVATFKVSPGQCAHELISAADTALYRAKNAGRNRVTAL